MSRIGRKPIVIPAGVEVTVAEGNVVTVKGPKGTLTQTMHGDMKITVGAGEVLVERPSEQKLHKSLHGLTRTLVANMVTGVSEGFKKELEINGVGYRAQKQGSKLVLSLGYSHPVEMEDIPGLTVEVPAPNKIVVSGSDKQAVGQLAAKIREKRPPEPYKGKGIKYVDERIIRKEGKVGKSKK